MKYSEEARGTTPPPHVVIRIVSLSPEPGLEEEPVQGMPGEPQRRALPSPTELAEERSLSSVRNALCPCQRCDGVLSAASAGLRAQPPL